METISLVKANQKDLSKSVKLVKKRIKSGEIKIKNEPVKKNFKKRFTKRLYPAIYIGHIPHGFYENEMKSYFGQFGKVITAVVARNGKTGKSRGFGFVEFADEDVAQIAAETMNNYLMYNRILKCTYIPPEKRTKNLRPTQENILKNKNTRKNKLVKQSNAAVAELSPDTYKTKVMNKLNKFKKLFKEKGISFNLEFDEFKPTKKSSKKSIKRTTKSSSDVTVEEQGVLEIDESDNDIHFKTPPKVKKIFKKSLNSSVGSEKMLLRSKKGGKTKAPKQRSKEIVKTKKVTGIKEKISEAEAPIKTTEKKKVQRKGIAQKFEEKVKPKNKSLAKSMKSKKIENVKNKSLKKGVKAMLKQEKGSKSSTTAVSKLGKDFVKKNKSK